MGQSRGETAETLGAPKLGDPWEQGFPLQPMEVIWVAPDSARCLPIRAAFDTLGVPLTRFDWISDWSEALSQIESRDFDLVLISNRFGLTGAELREACDGLGRQMLSWVLVAEDEQTKPQEEQSVVFIDHLSAAEFSAVLSSRLLKTVQDRMRWRRLIEHHRSFETLIASISTRFIRLPLPDLDA